MTMYLKDGGIWKEDAPKLKDAGIWKDVETGYVNVGGVWKPFFENAGKYQLLADITVSVSAVTQVDITGLSLDKNSEYLLVSDLVNTTGSTASVFLFANGNVGTYYTQRIEASGTTISSTRYNASYVVEATTSSRGMALTNIKLTNSGYFVFQSEVQRGYGTSSNLLQIDYCSSTFTTSGITVLNLVSGMTNCIGVGSRFQLYKIGGA